MKKKLLEYYVGDPDGIDNYEKGIRLEWEDEHAIAFGYFPVSIFNDYEFFVGEGSSHMDFSREAAKKIIGKADSHLRIGEKNPIRNKCYIKAYGIGRYWNYGNEMSRNIITFWYSPSSELLKDIVNKLGIDPNNFIIVAKNEINMTVADYIKMNKKGDAENIRRKEAPFDIDNFATKIIKSYNYPDKTWQSQKQKEGWNTLAQRNATIYQEKKEPKDTLKETDMKENKYQKEFSNYIEIMNEALKRNDFKAYDVAKKMLEESIDDSKQEEALLAELKTNNFGILNHIFEQQLPTLFKSNKKAVRDVIKTIKEDKNLLEEFNFYNTIKTRYKGETANLIESKYVLEKLAEISVNGIDQKTVRESNKKLRKVMLENNIVPTEFVDEESKKLYESGHIILTHKKTTANMIPLMESYHNVCQYMEKHKNDVVKDNKNPDELIREFEEKLKTNLNESEISFVQQITDFRTPIAEKRKEKLFNKFKNECLEKINTMLKEDAENSSLIDLSKQINEMTFDKNNIVKDIAKLLEIRDILMDD